MDKVLTREEVEKWIDDFASSMTDLSTAVTKLEISCRRIGNSIVKLRMKIEDMEDESE